MNTWLFYRIEFGEVAPVMNANVSDFIYALTHDEYIPGNILVSTQYQIFTADIRQQNTLWLTGQVPLRKGRVVNYAEGNSSQAKFNVIIDLLFLTNSTVIVLDTFNSVLRVLNRSSLETELFAGDPNVVQEAGGDLQTCTFKNPFGIVTADNKTFYISQYGSILTAVLTLLNNYHHVSHVGIFQYPSFRLFANIYTGLIYGHTPNRITRFVYNPSEVIFTPIAGSSATDYVDGSLNEARFLNLGYLSFLSNTTLLILDDDSKVLRVVDLTGNVSSICLNNATRSSGKHISNCTLPQITTILRFNSSLVLLASNNTIIGLKCEYTYYTL